MAKFELALHMGNVEVTRGPNVELVQACQRAPVSAMFGAGGQDRLESNGHKGTSSSDEFLQSKKSPTGNPSPSAKLTHGTKKGRGLEKETGGWVQSGT